MARPIVLSTETINEMTSLFKQGTSIPELMTIFSLGRNKITRTLRAELKDEYTVYARKIIAGCGKKSAQKLKGRKHGPMPVEQRKKISDAQRGRKIPAPRRRKISESCQKFNEEHPGLRKELAVRAVATKRANGFFEKHSQKHSQWMRENAPMRGKRHSEETRRKMRDAKRRFFENEET